MPGIEIERLAARRIRLLYHNRPAHGIAQRAADSLDAGSLRFDKSRDASSIDIEMPGLYAERIDLQLLAAELVVGRLGLSLFRCVGGGNHIRHPAEHVVFCHGPDTERT